MAKLILYSFDSSYKGSPQVIVLDSSFPIRMGDKLRRNDTWFAYHVVPAQSLPLRMQGRESKGFENTTIVVERGEE